VSRLPKAPVGLGLDAAFLSGKLRSHDDEPSPDNAQREWGASTTASGVCSKAHSADYINRAIGSGKIP